MARLQLGIAGPEDASELSRLLTESTHGAAMPPFALDRADDIYRIMDVRGEDWKVIVTRDTESDGRLAAYASVAYRQCYVNGSLRRVPHMLDTFFSPQYRNGMLLGRAFKYVKEQALEGENFAQSQVCINNKVALGAFTSRKAGLPAFLPYGEHAFITMPIGDVSGMGRAGAAARRVEVRCAEESDIPGMEAFFRQWAPDKQFYPSYSFDKLGSGYYRSISIGDFFLGFRNGRLAGLIGTWDQQEFKSTHYLTAEPGLDAGTRDQPLFLHTVLTERNDPAVLAALVDGIRATFDDSVYGFLALGLDALDPLRYGLEHIPQSVSLTKHFLVAYGEDPRPGLIAGLFYLDSARC